MTVGRRDLAAPQIQSASIEPVVDEVEMMFQHLPPAEAEAVAAAMVHARASGKSVSSMSLPVLPDASSAMRVQALVREQSVQCLHGWKVAIGPESMPVAAPLFDLYTAPADIPLFSGCAVEVELAVVLGRDIPPRESGAYDRADIVDAVESLFLGLEVIGGRFADAASVPFLSFLADNLGNRAYVLGDKLSLSCLDEVEGLDCRVTLDGSSLSHAPASHPAADPLAPLLAYANDQNDYLGGLRAGQIVTTGSLCGVLPVRTKGVLIAQIERLGQVSSRFSG